MKRVQLNMSPNRDKAKLIQQAADELDQSAAAFALDVSVAAAEAVVRRLVEVEEQS